MSFIKDPQSDPDQPSTIVSTTGMATSPNSFKGEPSALEARNSLLSKKSQTPPAISSSLSDPTLLSDWERYYWNPSLLAQKIMREMMSEMSEESQSPDPATSSSFASKPLRPRLSDEQLKAMFDVWVKDRGRKYSGEAERARRFEAFARCARYVYEEEHTHDDAGLTDMVDRLPGEGCFGPINQTPVDYTIFDPILYPNQGR